MTERSAFQGDLPGSRRSPCLGCDGPVRSARDAHVRVGGTRDGSWLALIDAEPNSIPVTDSARIPQRDIFLLGLAHRSCIDLARRRLVERSVALPDELPTLVVEEIPDDEPEHMHLPPTEGRCPFCGLTDSLTDEHVWPGWVSRELRGEGRTLTLGVNGQEPKPVRSIPITVPLCEQCNNRWLSVLENDVRPILQPMIHGGNHDLTPAAQQLLATWAVKTALMIDLTEPDSSIIPVGFYRQFRQQRRALPNTVVWTAGYLGSRWAAWAARQPLHLGSPPPTRPNAFLTTFTVHRVVFQVCGYFTRGGATVNDRRWQFAPALEAIWPPRNEVIRWPRNGCAFGDDELQELAVSFDSGSPSEMSAR